MKQSPSGEANISSASQEIPRILWTWRFITVKRPPPFPILSQINPVQASVSHFLIIHFLLGLFSYLRLLLPSDLFLSGSSTSRVSHTCYMPRSYPFFGDPNNICWAVQIIKLLIMQFSPLPCHLVPLRSKCLPQHPILKHPPPMFLPRCERPSCTPIQNNRQSYSSLYLNLFIIGYNFQTTCNTTGEIKWTYEDWWVASR